ncbi:MAG: hypothetical protein JWO58_563, partial [Chitinophagaceae bacterium]|nr:hypothetical protein [Chitinophagaceae bacterium]
VDYPSVCLGDTVRVTFNGASSTWVYLFGDGPSSTSNASLPMHTYLSTSPSGGYQFEQLVNTATTHTDPVTGASENYVYYIIPITVADTSKINLTYKACANGDVYVYIADNRFDAYDISFGDGATTTATRAAGSDTTTTFHNYTSIAPFNVIVKGKFTKGNTCKAADASITVQPIAAIPKPNVTYLETTVEDLANGELQVNFINTSGYTYDLQFKRNGFPYNTVATVPTTATSFTFNKTNTGFPSLNTQQVEYCVKVYTSISGCGTSVQYDEICSVTKFNLTAADLENDLTWVTTPASGQTITSMDILRDANAPVVLPGAPTSYNDNTGITCTTSYQYQVKAVLSTTSSLGAQYSLGPKKSITATSLTTRPALTNVNSTINGSSINVTFDAVGGGFTAKTYTLMESVNGGAYNSAASNNGSPTNFTLTGRNTSTDTYCYQVNYVDQCNLSPITGSAVTTCPIKLTIGLAEDGTVAINWTSYSGSNTVGTYTIEVRDENGTVIKTIPGGSGTSATDLLSSSGGQLYYIVIADNGSTSALVELELSPAVFVPNAFSPNGDGTNDHFELKGRFIKSVEVSIFDRWGEPVFHSTDIKDQWDGKVKGSDAMVGTYAYTVDVVGIKGESIKQRGTVSLVR